jgi:hypothetical protein
MFSATESKSGTRTPHEYIRDTISSDLEIVNSVEPELNLPV